MCKIADSKNSLALEFEHVVFGYPKTAGLNSSPVINDLSFSVSHGEFVALLGNNGSGKSTIAHLATGMLQPSKGTVKILGFDSTSPDAIKNIRTKTGLVFQNPDDQIVCTKVEDEVAFGPENLGWEHNRIVNAVSSALEKVQMSGTEDADVNTLSGGQRQKIAIAGVLAMSPELLVLDEATSMLDPDSRQALMDTVVSLHKQGMTVLMITHFPEEAKMADRTLVIENGCISKKTLDDAIKMRDEEIARLSTRAKVIANERVKDSIKSEDFSKNTKDQVPAIEFKDVCFSYDQEKLVLDHVNLEFQRNQIYAITGSNGCGKSTLVKHMNGLLQPTSGEVVVLGEDISRKNTAHKKEKDSRFANAQGTQGINFARAKVGLAFQYPERQLFAQSVYDDIAFGPKNLGFSKEMQSKAVDEAIKITGLDTTLLNKSPFQLSGGQQRKVALAGVVAMRPEILVLDEPCVSLDVPSKLNLLEMILSLNEAGLTIIMVTHDLAEARAINAIEIAM